MSKDSGKLIDFTLTPPKSATCKPTYGSTSSGVTIPGRAGQDIKTRTASSAAEGEKLYEPVPGGPSK